MTGGDASAVLQQAVALAEAGDATAAVPLFQQATQLEPSSAEAQEMLAQACMEAGGRDEEAYEASAAAVRLAPDWIDARLTLARAARNCGRLQEAAACLCAVMEARPADQEAAGELAEVQQLRRLQVGHQVGLPGLQVEQQQDAQAGPAGSVWEAGALLAWFLVHYSSSSMNSEAQSEPLPLGSGCCSAPGCTEPDACTVTAASAATAAAGQQRHTCGSTGPHASAITGSSRGSSMLKRAQVLELGSGTGIAGLAAACLGAQVVATDLPAALPLLEANLRHNQTMVCAAGGSIIATPLDWSQPPASSLAALSASLKPALEAPQHELRQPESAQFPFSWLLGADLVYALAPVESLVNTIAAAQAAAAAQGLHLCVLISHKHRHTDVDMALLSGLRRAGLPLQALLRDPGSRCTVYGNAAAAQALAGGQDD